MKKKIAVFVAAALCVAAVLSLCACTTYKCSKCGKSTSDAYYTMSASKDSVMCADCARQYWMPLPIDNYRV